MKKLFFLLILLSSLLVAAKAAGATDKTDVMKVSRRAVLALRDKNMAGLAALVHPAKGVRFSAYGYIDKEGDLVFKRPQVSRLLDNKTLYQWGEYDGSGDPIKMRFVKYYAAFIYDRDFARAPHVDYNNVIGRGNTIVNIVEAYPNGKFVEYHFPDSQDGGAMNWNSLRLVFEKSGKQWYLVGISHDEWTI
jgi:hypothetical protein